MEGFYFTTLEILRTLSRYDDTWGRNRKIDLLLAFSEASRFSWDAYYGDMYFLFDFSKKRINYVYEKIYIPIINVDHEINYDAIHLELFRNGDANNSAFVDGMITKIESMLISKEQRVIESGGEQCTVTNVNYILTNPIYKELDGRYYDLMYGKSYRRAK